MADTLTLAERSDRMSRIPGRDTKPELLVRKHLHLAGLRFRLHRANLPGRPDIVLPKYATVVFVEGCFWHGHRCQKRRIPATNTKFWASKIATNRARDQRNHRALRRAGWQVLRIWECQLAKAATRAAVLERLVGAIRREP
jgi:DNA mismatch endonuclease (patch repair protein)